MSEYFRHQHEGETRGENCCTNYYRESGVDVQARRQPHYRCDLSVTRGMTVVFRSWPGIDASDMPHLVQASAVFWYPGRVPATQLKPDFSFTQQPLPVPTNQVTSIPGKSKKKPRSGGLQSICRSSLQVFGRCECACQRAILVCWHPPFSPDRTPATESPETCLFRGFDRAYGRNLRLRLFLY